MEAKFNRTEIDPESDRRASIITEVKERLAAHPVELIPAAREVTREALGVAGDDRRVILCDCYLQGAEEGQYTAYGLEFPDLINIDHHSALPQFAKAVSSGNLALEYVKKHGVADPSEYRVVINHSDADSIISSGIVSGNLETLSHYGEAVLAADHTGAPNLIADLGQALQFKRDVEFSLRNLRLLEKGLALEPEAQKLLAKRQHERELAKQLVESGIFKQHGRVWLGLTDKKYDTSLFAAYMPEAEIIAISNPMPGSDSLWNTSLRLGLAAPEGLTIHNLKINDFEPNYGGRWNAGSTKRGGGSKLEPAEFADLLDKSLRAWHDKQTLNT